MMKKKIIPVLALTMLASLFTLPTTNLNNNSTFEGLTPSVTVEGEKGISLLDLRKQALEETTTLSTKMYVQHATAESGNHWIRFATAVKGNVSSLEYTLTVGDNVITDTKAVSTVYKGISAAGETLYYDGEKTVNEDPNSGYYWACYTIEFTSEAHFNSNLNVGIKVNNNKDFNLTRTSSLESFVGSKGLSFSQTNPDRNYETEEFYLVNVSSNYAEPNSTVYIPSTYNGKIVGGIRKFKSSTVTRIVLPNTIKIICSNALDNASGLQYINLPEGLESIGNSSFGHLGTLKEIRIPSTVTKIGDHPFINCNSLNSLEVAEGNPYYHSLDGGLIETSTMRLINLAANTMNIPDGVKVVGKCVFFKKNDVSSIFVPKSVEKFETQSFDRINTSGTQSVIINYEGTEEEWNAIEKESNWNNEVSVTVNYNQTRA